jgi:uncharacterized protein
VKLWRLYVISALIVLPVVVLVGAGMMALWRTGLYVWLWWLLPVCWLPAWLLAHYWRRQLVAASASLGEPAAYWTPRDEAAWSLVRAEQQRALQIPPDRLIDPHFYLQSVMALAMDIARHYRPQAKDPVGSRTVLEILAVAQLALEDSHRWITEYVPGSHLLSVDQWRLLAQTPRWMTLAGNVGWAVSIAANPANLGRFVASKLTVDSGSRQLQDNALAWFYAMFVGRAGFYLIEMNSGRLRGDPQRYRQLTRSSGAAPGAAPQEASQPRQQQPQPTQVVIAVVGQVKAGKSSLINALIEQRAAEVDALPATSDVRQYRMSEDGRELVLLDTPGYADQGATEQQLKAIRTALAGADLVLLVLKVTSPARQADLSVLRELQQASAARPDRKPPPILGVLTHIDQLSPVMEWNPPYNWMQPVVRKEEQIREAVQYHGELFEASLAGVIPVCSDLAHERVDGVRQWLLPAIVELLGTAHGCAVLRILDDQARQGQVRRVFHQVAKIGLVLLNACRPRRPK